MKFCAFILTLSLAATASAQLRAPKAVPTKSPVKPATKPALPATPAVPAKPVKPIEEADTTAIGALKLLPKDMARRVARIEAREGHPWPERWYVLVFDPSVPHGVREFVFSEGKMITSRTLSQFADTLTKEDAVGAEAIRLNNDTAAGMAVQFAIANGKRLGTVEYALRKAAPGIAVWRLTCSDSGGSPMGAIELHAAKGTVVGFEGFENSPVTVQPLPPPKPIAAAKAKPAKPGEKATQPKTATPPAPATKPGKTAAEQPPVEKPAPAKPIAAVPAEQPVPEKPAAIVVTEKPASAAPVAADSFGEKPFSPLSPIAESPAKSVAEKAPAEKSPSDKAAAHSPAPASERSAVAATPKADPPAKKPAPAEPPKAIPVARTVPAPEPNPAPGTVKRIGNSVKRLFGRDE